MRRLAPIVIALALLALWPTPAGADDPPLRRQPDLVLTHNGHTSIIEAIAVWSAATGGMVQDGGLSADPDIEGITDPDFAERGRSNVVRVGPPLFATIAHCTVTVRADDDLAAWVHEIGHCLFGDIHFQVRGAVMQTGANADGKPNWYDLFQFHLRYGFGGVPQQAGGYALFIPMVTGG